MINQKLVNEIREFGLNEYEAKAYLTLSQYGPLTASLLSTRGSIPQSKVYEVVRSLEIKSMAETWPSKPKKFKAIPPIIALNRLISSKTNHIDLLRQKYRKISDEIKPVSEGEVQDMLISSGLENLLEKKIGMIENSSDFLYFTSNKFHRYPKLDFTLKESEIKNIKAIGFGKLDEASSVRSEWYKNNFDVKLIGEETSVFWVSDKGICILMEDTMNPNFIWSNNKFLIKTLKTYFEGLWNKQ